MLQNRCDQKLPKCTNCNKAHVSSVGFYPVSKLEIPHSYVHYLEHPVVNLKAVVAANNIAFPPAQYDFAISENIKTDINVPFPVQDDHLDHDNYQVTNADHAYPGSGNGKSPR
ncbi:hypothetical protein GCG54_00015407 [Colletotrichum gloeosporioides]|uniref:Uncharacterized protein n=1 Tax=Colletotrichum gloeosporioides TaxID=474922 RepID=A0A8H4FKU3_COLGL|nr:uncharacterized protein GCG54_00015407 [Colletotrichum gloeosporioides]KAF3805847.1 hypothetical protein GCG54_00015407 [Colletotrichum gloeosporioides]